MHQNSVFSEQKSKQISGEGQAASPYPSPSGEGDTPSPHPTPLGAAGASILAPAALDFGRDLAPFWNHFKHWLQYISILYITIY